MMALNMQKGVVYNLNSSEHTLARNVPWVTSGNAIMFRIFEYSKKSQSKFQSKEQVVF